MTKNLKSLSIIGCGNVAKTLGYLLGRKSDVSINDVLNRTGTSAKRSVDFIGTGNPVDSYSKLKDADIFLIGCQDDLLTACVDQLIDSQVIKSGNIVFHCSGSKSSGLLINLKQEGACVASVHPVKSFASPIDAVDSFSGTHCGIEGDAPAISELTRLITSIGGLPFEIDAEQKMLYHAASVFACNYFIALEELSLTLFQQCGVDRKKAMRILEPIVKNTTENIFTLGTTKALTGPIARGDFQVIDEQLKAVDDWQEDAGEMYRLLAKVCLQLSEQQGSASEDSLTEIKRILEE